jgi:hypothetical protein
MQVSDDLYLGRAVGPIGVNQGVGPVARLYSIDIVPAAAGTTNVAPLQTLAAAGTLTLAGGAGTVYAQSYTGAWRTTMDVPRVVSLTSANDLSGVQFTVTGHDAYNQRMAQTLNGPAANTVSTQKAFKSVSSITTNGAATAVSAGAGSALGLPYAVTDAGYVIEIGWAGAVAKDAGTLVVADSSASTVYTGDPRGTYTPSSAANGVRRLCMTVALSDAQAGPNATRDSLVGSAQSLSTFAALAKLYLDGGAADSNYYVFFDAGLSAGGYSTAAVIGGTA